MRAVGRSGVPPKMARMLGTLAACLLIREGMWGVACWQKDNGPSRDSVAVSAISRHARCSAPFMFLRCSCSAKVAEAAAGFETLIALSLQNCAFPISTYITALSVLWIGFRRFPGPFSSLLAPSPSVSHHTLCPFKSDDMRATVRPSWPSASCPFLYFCSSSSI